MQKSARELSHGLNFSDMKTTKIKMESKVSGEWYIFSVFTSLNHLLCSSSSMSVSVFTCFIFLFLFSLKVFL